MLKTFLWLHWQHLVSRQATSSTWIRQVYQDCTWTRQRSTGTSRPSIRKRRLSTWILPILRHARWGFPSLQMDCPPWNVCGSCLFVCENRLRGLFEGGVLSDYQQFGCPCSSACQQLVNSLSRFGTTKGTCNPSRWGLTLWYLERIDGQNMTKCWATGAGFRSSNVSRYQQLFCLGTGLWRHQSLGNCTTVGLHWLERYGSARPADALNKFQLCDIRCQWASCDSDFNVCVVPTGDPEITCPLGLTRAQIAKKQAASCAVLLKLTMHEDAKRSEFEKCAINYTDAILIRFLLANWVKS